MGAGHEQFLLVCATVFYFATAQPGNRVNIPTTRFTCQGRPAGYYADVDTGCQVYHMCDGLGRQFSYSCPNTTLFQQRMLICDHWYMVNCSNSENDYDANLLIGQRDKPFVSEEEMRLRTPRPDILSVPPNNYYYEGLKEAETKYISHPDNSIADDEDTVINEDDNDLDSDKQIHRVIPSPRPTEEDTRLIEPAVDQSNTNHQGISLPSKELTPPRLPTTTEEPSDFDIDIRMNGNSDPVVNFIKRFDPNSPDSLKTAMTQKEIIDINHNLPTEPAYSEEERNPKKHQNFGNNVNLVQNEKKGSTDETRFNTVNSKANTEINVNNISDPSLELEPPKSEYATIISTTMGPPIYYEWKWAVPAFDLEPPKSNNETNTTSIPQRVPETNRPFSVVPRSTPKTVDLKTSNTEYNISSYFVPDYVFPLDGAHPGYENEDAQTSFQVQVAGPGRASYGENPNCPHCHPAYLNPGTCEPCIVKR